MRLYLGQLAALQAALYPAQCAHVLGCCVEWPSLSMDGPCVFEASSEGGADRIGAPSSTLEG